MSGGGRSGSFARAAATTYATNLTVASLSLVNVLIVARALGPSGRGDVAFLIAVGVVTAHLASLSLQEANANLAGSEPEQRPALASNSLVIAALLGLGAAGVVAGLVGIFPALGGEVDRVLLAITLAAIPLVVLKTYLGLLVQADYAFGITNLAWLAGPLTSFAANLGLAALGLLTVGSAIIAWCAGQAFGALLLVHYVRRHAGFGRLQLQLASRSLRFGAKAHVGRSMEVGTYRVDQWFLGAISGSRELGLYSIAVAWAEVLFYLPGILVLVQRPDLVRATPEEARRLASRVLRGAVLLAGALAAFLIVAAPVLCLTVFGHEFAGSVDDLRVLALGAVGIATFTLLRSALTAQRRPILASVGGAVAFALTIVLDILLIPSQGGTGAAIATAVAYTGGGIVVALIFTRTLHGRLRDLVPRPADAAWLWQRVWGVVGPRLAFGRGGR